MSSIDRRSLYAGFMVIALSCVFATSALVAQSSVVAAVGTRVPLPSRVARRIPAEGKDYLLSRVGGIVALPDGHVWVLSVDERAIRVLDPRNNLVRSIGREGAGPGEFRAPRMMGLTGDRVWVWDVSLARVTVFRLDGTLDATYTVPVRGHGVLFRDNSIGIFPARSYGTTNARQDSLFVRRLVKGNPSTIFYATAPYRVLRVPMGGSMIVGKQPFDDEPLLGFAGSGSGFVFVDLRVPSRGGVRRFQVTRMGIAGDTAYSRAYSYQPMKVSPAEIEQELNRLVGPLPANEARAARASFRQALFVPEFLPPVTAALVGSDGSVWLRRERPARASTDRWLILNAGGAPDQEVAIDRDFAPYTAGRGVLWGVRTDENGESEIIQLTIDRTAGRP